MIKDLIELVGRLQKRSPEVDIHSYAFSYELGQMRAFDECINLLIQLIRQHHNKPVEQTAKNQQARTILDKINTKDNRGST